MKRFNTLRVRFGLWTAGLILIILIGFSLYVYGRMQRDLSAAIDNSLTLNAAQIAAGLDIEDGKLNLSDSLLESPENADLRGRGFTIRILTPEGTPLQEFGPYQGLPVATEQSFVTFEDGETAVRLYTQPVYDNNQLTAVVQVAQSLADIAATLARLRLTLWVSVPLLVLLAGISGYFLAARALAPIDQITATARRISAEDLSARLNLPTADDEVGRLAHTLDAMLARLDDSFQRERQFTNDASHELRTPLTAMQAILGMIRAKRRSAEEYEEALDDLAEEADRLRTLVENLLQLARSDKQADTLHESVDLSTLLQDVADSLRPLAEAKELELICQTPEKLIIQGDSDELIRLFVNLLDNAIKFTERGNITMAASRSGQKITATVTDTGVGIPPEQLPHIFDRFYRGEQSRTSTGTGLGLAIAKEIVRVHGGIIETYPASGRGTTVAVHLPRKLGEM